MLHLELTFDELKNCTFMNERVKGHLLDRLDTDAPAPYIQKVVISLEKVSTFTEDTYAHAITDTQDIYLPYFCDTAQKYSSGDELLGFYLDEVLNVQGKIIGKSFIQLSENDPFNCLRLSISIITDDTRKTNLFNVLNSLISLYKRSSVNSF